MGIHGHAFPCLHEDCCVDWQEAAYVPPDPLGCFQFSGLDARGRRRWVTQLLNRPGANRPQWLLVLAREMASSSTSAVPGKMPNSISGWCLRKYFTSQP